MSRILFWLATAVATVVFSAAIEPFCSPGTSCFRCCCDWANTQCRVSCHLWPNPAACEACHMAHCNACYQQKCMDQDWAYVPENEGVVVHRRPAHLRDAIGVAAELHTGWDGVTDDGVDCSGQPWYSITGRRIVGGFEDGQTQRQTKR